MKYSRYTLILASGFLLIVPAVTAQSGPESRTTQRHIVINATSGQPAARHVTVGPVEEMQVGLKTVKGAPYSGETESETVQLLGDGNRIVRRNSSRVYRDSEGRTRQEYSFAPGEGTQSAGIVAIHDPVAGIDYTLDTESRTAEKIVFRGTLRHNPEGEGGTAQWQSDDNTSFFIRKTPSPLMAKIMAAQPGTENTFVVHVTEKESLEQNFTSESLGKRIMEGVEVEGERTSVTLPAGAIGNELPIVTTTETWFCPELQMRIYSKREDPLSGTTTFRVTKLVRGEPDAALFRPPAGYEVNEGGLKFIHEVERAPEK